MVDAIRLCLQGVQRGRRLITADRREQRVLEDFLVQLRAAAGK